MTAKVIRLPTREREQPTTRPLFMIVGGKEAGTWVVRYSDDDRVVNVPPVTAEELKELRDTIDLMLMVEGHGA